MATTLSSTHSQAFTPVPDFIQQARTCENIINTLGESDDPIQRQALSNQLHATLRQLQPDLLDPIPLCLTDSFTVDALPECAPRFEPDCTALCRYCIVLSTVLAEQDAAGKTGTALRDLLCELTGYFVDEMMAPRWIRSEEGVSQIQYA